MPVSTAKNRAPELRKAAILVSALDQATADALLDQMDPDQDARVRRALVDLEEIDPREQRAVIDEFFRGGLPAPVKQAVGVELALGSQSAPAIPPADANEVAAQGDRPFRFLHDA